MTTSVKALLTTMQQLERLKDTLRTAWTSQGRHESTAEHSWRLALFCCLASDYFPQASQQKLVEMALCHDLGEAYTGDIAAPQQGNRPAKLLAEADSLNQLFQALPEKQAEHFLSLIAEYNTGETYEAKIVKALDKLETIIQHNQGENPADFDYSFNLTYGQKLSDALPELAELRQLINEETQKHCQ